MPDQGKSKFRFKLQHRIIFLAVVIILLIIIQTGALFYYTVSNTVQQQIGKRALHVSNIVASMPEIREAFKTEEPWKIIQPIVERIRVETGAEFIVVGNKDGVRYSHPVPERIGKEMVGGDNDRALLKGESYVSKAVGTLGPSLRGKVPVLDESGNIIGVVSVGFLIEDIEETVGLYGSRILWIAFSGLLIGIFGSVYLARKIKKSMFGLEPEEISSLYKERVAVIESIREGIMVINKTGNIVLVNQTAYDILSLPQGETIIGKPVTEVIPNTNLLEVLHTGEEQLDREMNLRGKVIVANRLPVKSGNEVIGVVSSFRLKSEIDQLTEELSQVRRYTEALRAQTHEFNNLLYTVSGLIQLQSYDEAIELIHKEVTVQQDIIQSIIQKLKDPWLGGIVVGFCNRARELKIDFILDRESSFTQLPPHLDSSHFVMILGNLIHNAFEAVEKNKEGERKARLFVIDVGDDIVIEVEDSGPGIDDSLLPHIFTRGFTTKEGEKRGYGLAKITELVERNGGNITIGQGELGGALFIVAIPKERGETSDTATD